MFNFKIIFLLILIPSLGQAGLGRITYDNQKACDAALSGQPLSNIWKNSNPGFLNGFYAIEGQATKWYFYSSNNTAYEGRIPNEASVEQKQSSFFPPASPGEPHPEKFTIFEINIPGQPPVLASMRGGTPMRSFQLFTGELPKGVKPFKMTLQVVRGQEPSARFNSWLKSKLTDLYGYYRDPSANRAKYDSFRKALTVCGKIPSLANFIKNLNTGLDHPEDHSLDGAAYQ